MKNAFIFLLFVCSTSRPIMAQTLEMGIGLNFIPQKGQVYALPYPGNPNPPVPDLEPVDELNVAFGMQYIFNIPVYKFGDNMAVGMQPGISGYYYQRINNQLGKEPITGYQIQNYAVFRLGSGATKYADNDLGIGVGVGAIYTGFRLPHKVEGRMLTPAIMLETKYRNYGFRFEYLLSTFNSTYQTHAGPIPKLETSFVQGYFTILFGENYR